MFTGKMNLDKIEKTNKRALRFMVSNNDAQYDQICHDEEILNVQRGCIKAAAIQMYKIKNHNVPIYIEELFKRRESAYNIRDNDLFDIPRFKTVGYGKRSFRYYGAKLWSNIPKEIKDKPSLKCFKDAITIWLRQCDISHIDFLN